MPEYPFTHDPSSAQLLDDLKKSFEDPEVVAALGQGARALRVIMNLSDRRVLAALLAHTLADEITGSLMSSALVSPRTHAQLWDLVGSQDVLFEVAQWGADDTAVRGQLSNLVARELGVADRWPTFGDDTDIDEFQKLIDRAATRVGWHVWSIDGAYPGVQLSVTSDAESDGAAGSD